MIHPLVIDAKPQPISIDPANAAVLVVDMQNDFGTKGGMFDRAGNKFLLGPMLTTLGVRMEVPGVPDEIERTHIVAHLRTLIDKPTSLP